MIEFARRILGSTAGVGSLFSGSFRDLLPGHIRMSGPAIRERILWFSGDATLTRVSGINWTTKEFICCPVSGLLDPFLPRHHQSIIIADIELLSLVISSVVCGETGEGIIHIEATDNSNATSWMSRKRAKRGIALNLLSTFSKRTITMRLRLVFLYSRTYQNVSADALTRNSVGQIEDWALGEGFARVEIPAIWEKFCKSVDPDELSRGCTPVCFSPRSDLLLSAVEWNPISYQVCETMRKFGIQPYQACTRHRFVEDIAVSYGIPRWDASMNSDFAGGPGATELDLHGFIHFASSRQFTYWVFILASHIDISEHIADYWDTIERIDSALLGDVLASRWIIMTHGNLSIPELEDGYGWRPLGTIGMRCLDLNISLEQNSRKGKRINPISDSVGQFIFVLSETGQMVMSGDSHIPCLTISEIRQPPWVWPARISGGGTSFYACFDSRSRRYGLLDSK